MTQRSPLSRRLIIGVTSAVLVGGAVIVPALAGTATPCGIAFTDPAGDVTDVGPGLAPNDPDLDVLNVGYGVTGDSFKAVISVAGLGDTSKYSLGDWFETSFTVNKHAVVLDAYRSYPVSPPTTDVPEVGTIGDVPFMKVDGNDVDSSLTQTYDKTASTVTFTLKSSDFSTLLGVAPTGATFSAMSASGNDGDMSLGNGFFTDEASGGTKTFTVGACGGAAPAPTGTGSPSPTASPTPTAAASGACTPTYTDPAGDAAFGAQGQSDPTGKSYDEDLDILDVTHTTSAGVFSSIIHVKALSDIGPANAFIDRFTALFTVNAKAVEVMGERDFSDPTSGEVDTTTLTVAGTATTVPVKMIADLKASTITLNIADPAFETALGGNVTGKPFTAMTAKAAERFGFLVVGGLIDTNDTATAPASASYVFGSNCSGAGTPAPTGTGSPTPSGSPSGSPSPSPSPTASGPAGGTLFDQPRAHCVAFTDPTGDADPTPTGQGNQKAVDLTQVNLKSPTDGSLQVYVQVADPSGFSLPAGESGLYTTTVTIAGKAIAVTFDNKGAVTATTVGGAASTDLVPTVKVNTAKSNFVVTMPKAGLEKALKTTLTPGIAVTNTTVATQVNMGSGPASHAFAADTATGTKPEEKTYAYGDNSCFLPPPGKFQVDSDASGQYTDTTELFATLTDADDTAVPGATVTAAFPGGAKVTTVTDSDGIADLKLPLGLTAGSHPITVAFAGTSDVGAVSVVLPFKVVAEKAVLKAVGTRGGASATLLDDDKHPIVGQTVVFTVGSKKYSVKTNAKGIAAIGSKIAKGTAIKIAFAAVAGKYTATPTYTVKAL